MNIDKICEQLTIDEKIRLLGGVGDWHTYDCNGKIPSIMMTDGPHGIRKLEQEKVGDIKRDFRLYLNGSLQKAYKIKLSI
jgi:beta-glucosidase